MKQEVHVPATHREHHAARVQQFILNALPGKKLRVTIELEKRERSDPQNRALFGLAYKILREQTGSEVNELHTVFCGEFFGWIEYEVMGNRRKRPRRTTTTDEDGKRDVIPTLEFSQFFAMVQQKAAVIGCFIPDPDPTHVDSGGG